MVGHDQGHPVVAMDLRAQLTDRELRLQQSLRRERAERQNHLRADQLDLADEVRRTGRDLLRERVPVTWRTMLEDIRNEDVLPREPDGADDLGEQLAGGSHEGFSLLVLV